MVDISNSKAPTSPMADISYPKASKLDCRQKLEHRLSWASELWVAKSLAATSPEYHAHCNVKREKKKNCLLDLAFGSWEDKYGSDYLSNVSDRDYVSFNNLLFVYSR